MGFKLNQQNKVENLKESKETEKFSKIDSKSHQLSDANDKSNDPSSNEEKSPSSSKTSYSSSPPCLHPDTKTSTPSGSPPTTPPMTSSVVKEEIKQEDTGLEESKGLCKRGQMEQEVWEGYRLWLESAGGEGTFQPTELSISSSPSIQHENLPQNPEEVSPKALSAKEEGKKLEEDMSEGITEVRKKVEEELKTSLSGEKKEDECSEKVEERLRVGQEDVSGEKEEEKDCLFDDGNKFNEKQQESSEKKTSIKKDEVNSAKSKENQSFGSSIKLTEISRNENKDTEDDIQDKDIGVKESENFDMKNQDKEDHDISSTVESSKVEHDDKEDADPIKISLKIIILAMIEYLRVKNQEQSRKNITKIANCIGEIAHDNTEGQLEVSNENGLLDEANIHSLDQTNCDILSTSSKSELNFHEESQKQDSGNSCFQKDQKTCCGSEDNTSNSQQDQTLVENTYSPFIEQKKEEDSKEETKEGEFKCSAKSSELTQVDSNQVVLNVKQEDIKDNECTNNQTIEEIQDTASLEDISQNLSQEEQNHDDEEQNHDDEEQNHDDEEQTHDDKEQKGREPVSITCDSDDKRESKMETIDKENKDLIKTEPDTNSQNEDTPTSTSQNALPPQEPPKNPPTDPKTLLNYPSYSHSTNQALTKIIQALTLPGTHPEEHPKIPKDKEETPSVPQAQEVLPEEEKQENVVEEKEPEAVEKNKKDELENCIELKEMSYRDIQKECDNENSEENKQHEDTLKEKENVESQGGETENDKTKINEFFEANPGKTLKKNKNVWKETNRSQNSQKNGDGNDESDCSENASLEEQNTNSDEMVSTKSKTNNEHNSKPKERSDTNLPEKEVTDPSNPNSSTNINSKTYTPPKEEHKETSEGPLLSKESSQEELPEEISESAQKENEENQILGNEERIGESNEGGCDDRGQGEMIRGVMDVYGGYGSGTENKEVEEEGQEKDVVCDEGSGGLEGAEEIKKDDNGRHEASIEQEESSREQENDGEVEKKDEKKSADNDEKKPTDNDEKGLSPKTSSDPTTPLNPSDLPQEKDLEAQNPTVKDPSISEKDQKGLGADITKGNEVKNQEEKKESIIIENNSESLKNDSITPKSKEHISSTPNSSLPTLLQKPLALKDKGNCILRQNYTQSSENYRKAFKNYSSAHEYLKTQFSKSELAANHSLQKSHSDLLRVVQMNKATTKIKLKEYKEAIQILEGMDKALYEGDKVSKRKYDYKMACAFNGIGEWQRAEKILYEVLKKGSRDPMIFKEYYKAKENLERKERKVSEEEKKGGDELCDDNQTSDSLNEEEGDKNNSDKWFKHIRKVHIVYTTIASFFVFLRVRAIFCKNK
ncbi:unnamed protein product [Moneuplotes crassus]|uniref:Uncharacterized protein n=1 Tax=Euplotes crassus TaxID=5936 RepID=A0AAD1UAS4_EUPCR|nr:unnamed protein product [Moneuplotes crassus]